MSSDGVMVTVAHWPPPAGVTGIVITPSMPLAARPAAADGGTNRYDSV